MKHNNKHGFTLVEILLVVAIIGLLAAIAIPAFVTARTQSRKNVCIGGLRQINSAKEQWALTENQKDGYEILPADKMGEEGIDSYIKGGEPSCPSLGTYTYHPVGTDPTCDQNEHVLP